MDARDACRFWLGALRGHGSRSAMLLMAMAIGVFFIALLGGLGQGARAYVLGEFSLLGRDLLIVLPGRNETTGGLPPITGMAPRSLTEADAAALSRLPAVRRVAPLQAGQAQVSRDNRSREALVLGTTRDFFAIRQLRLAQGRPLPELEPGQLGHVAVIGGRLRQALFGEAPALGRWVRAGDRRFRVIGVLEARGESLGMDLSEALIVPVASAEALFNREGLQRIFVEARGPGYLDGARRQVLALLTERHQGEEDVTLLSQDAMLAAFDGILDGLTLALAGVAALSLLVAGILIMNVTWVAVLQRSAEIGLLKALGATGGQVRLLFLGEAGLLALLGAGTGLALAELLLWGGRLLSELPLYAPWWARLGAPLLALLAALLFAWLPASQAAAQAPVQALRPQGSL
ncbi:peptide ABC transporter permease [Pseudomonas sp. A46]|uniref:ABC transporter permease n=1 Tax=Metapseudomonas furukawaii TaxID=1149133 RepID=UPI000B4A3E92|nr:MULTISPECIES: ABC transporter permease [Pseudomonas]OWJ95424.1 peptide ABC transporter permease [Pseudomonas sp. A46]WAG79018.1 ABC transporter permease [Pseudomonas furukawaii]